MKYQAALFDLDGTLTDSGEGIIQTGIRAAAQMGFGAPERDQLLRMRGPALIWSFTTLFGMTEAQALETIKHYRAFYPTVGPKYTTVFEGIPEMLQTLKNTGLQLYVCTAKYEVQAQMLCEKFGLAPYFDRIYGTGAPELHETKAQILARILDDNGLDVRDAVMIGDKDMDILAGSENGVDTIGVRYGYGIGDELERAGATYVVEDVAALTAFLTE